MKTNTILHRYLALFLGIVMLWSMLPLSVSAAKEMFLTNEVSAVSLLDITAPAAQSKPDMTAECVRGDRYKVIDMFWTPSVSYGDKVITIEADEFFGFSTAYTVHVILEAIGDHYFKTTSERLSATKAFVNNAEATAKVAPYEYLHASGYDYDVQHTKLLEVTYTFPTTASTVTVDHVDLTIDPPVAGEKVQTKDMYFSDEMIGKVRYEHQQEILKLSWYHNNTEMKPNDTFVYGEEYLAMVYLTTYTSGVKFAVDNEKPLFGMPNTAVKAFVNGEAADSVMPNNQSGTALTHIVVGKIFTCDEKQQIKNIDISGIDVPNAGANADYTAVLGSKTYKLQNKNNTAVKNGIYWTLKDENSLSVRDLLIAESTFDENSSYAVTVKVVPANENYEFAADAQVTLNGIPVYANITKELVSVSYIFPRTQTIPLTPIDTVTITRVDLAPTSLKHTLTGLEKVTGGAEISDMLWLQLPQSNWRHGEAELMLKAADGSMFTSETVVSVNGYYGQNVFISDDGKNAVYHFIFAPVFKEDPREHEHQYSYGYSPFEHWLECDCGESAAFGAHDMDENKTCKVCGYKIYDITALPFTDVTSDDYFAQAVGWAYENEITKGTSATTFAPNATCTRSEVVTFLWRAAGCPEPTTTLNPFTDVKKTDWYYKAVLWAVEHNITQGTSKTTFSPERKCSTAEILTFLFRAVGAGSNGYYAEAAAWAESLDLVYVTGLDVDPNVPCPRKAIVSFLYGIYQ